MECELGPRQPDRLPGLLAFRGIMGLAVRIVGARRARRAPKIPANAANWHSANDHRNRAAGMSRRARALMSLCENSPLEFRRPQPTWTHRARWARHAVPLRSRHHVFTQALMGAALLRAYELLAPASRETTSESVGVSGLQLGRNWAQHAVPTALLSVLRAGPRAPGCAR
jgi:hypothetical protein